MKQLIVVVIPLVIGTSHSVRAFELSSDVVPAPKIQLYRGADVLTGEPLSSCFSFEDDFDKSAESRFLSTMKDKQTTESKARKVTESMSLEAKGSYGAASGKAKASLSTSVSTSSKFDSRNLVPTFLGT
ncbi:hypothetical protein ACVI1J_005583 [Bradyrhizobium diazoefficiens]